MVVHWGTWPVCPRRVDLSRSETDSGPACAAQLGSAEPPPTSMQKSPQTWTQQHFLVDGAGALVSLKDSLLSTSGFSSGGICLPKHAAKCAFRQQIRLFGGTIYHSSKMHVAVQSVQIKNVIALVTGWTALNFP